MLLQEVIAVSSVCNTLVAKLARDLHLAGHRIAALGQPVTVSPAVSPPKLSFSQQAACDDSPHIYRYISSDPVIFSSVLSISAQKSHTSSLPEEVAQLSAEIQVPLIPYASMYDCRSVEPVCPQPTPTPVKPSLQIRAPKPVLQSSVEGQLFHLGGDCEVHIGRGQFCVNAIMYQKLVCLDGRFYLLDLARLLPPGTSTSK
jgi:hypothetical protein